MGRLRASPGPPAVSRRRRPLSPGANAVCAPLLGSRATCPQSHAIAASPAPGIAVVDCGMAAKANCVPAILAVALTSCGGTADCIKLIDRYEQLSVHALDCGESLAFDSDENYDVVECLLASAAACRAGRGKLLARGEHGATLYGLVVDSECQITLLSGESPGEPDIGFSEQVCRSIVPTMTAPGFVVDECSAKIDYSSCD